MVVSIVALVTGTDSHQERQEGCFPFYLWRPGHPPAPQLQPPSSPNASLSSSRGDEEEQQDDALPSSLSGMARHFQAQRAAKAHGRKAPHLPPKPTRYSNSFLPVGIASQV